MAQTKGKGVKEGQNLLRFYDFVKKREAIACSLPAEPFNSSELRLLTEVMLAQNKGERLISTRLAERMHVTRSAISQIVNNLEARGVVARVPDAVDRKIAWIELTPEMEKSCKKSLKKAKEFTDSIIQEFGEERFEMMCSLFEEFYELSQEHQKRLQNGD
jgi:DNA-binding MarR family transcriptional regulator